MRSWQKTRSELISSGQHIAITRDYLQGIQVIRVFSAYGDGGFGNQMCLVNIIKRLCELGFKGNIEIIATPYTYTHRKNPGASALKKITKLYNVNSEFQDQLAIRLTENVTITFINATYFWQQPQN